VTNGDAEFRGATKVEISHLREQIKEIRSDLKSISDGLIQLESFRSRVLALASVGAGLATLIVQFALNKVGS